MADEKLNAIFDKWDEAFQGLADGPEPSFTPNGPTKITVNDTVTLRQLGDCPYAYTSDPVASVEPEGATQPARVREIAEQVAKPCADHFYNPETGYVECKDCENRSRAGDAPQIPPPPIPADLKDVYERLLPGATGIGSLSAKSFIERIGRAEAALAAERSNPMHLLGAILDCVDSASNDDPRGEIREYVAGLQNEMLSASLPQGEPRCCDEWPECVHMFRWHEHLQAKVSNERLAQILAAGTLWCGDKESQPMAEELLKLRAALAAERDRTQKLENALTRIVGIPHKLDGGDWDEIEEAQKIALGALSHPTQAALAAERQRTLDEVLKAVEGNLLDKSKPSLLAGTPVGNTWDAAVGACLITVRAMSRPASTGEPQ
jgi:hypothetical protein